MHDPVKNPSHYMLFADGTQALDVIRTILTPDEFRGYCKGNIMKYRLRAGKKADCTQQDIDKANRYAQLLEASLEGSSD